MKLHLEKIPLLGTKFWRELGGKIKFWVKGDALIGLMQNNTQGHSYKSAQYVKYKANEMRKFGRGKKKTGAGERLKAYKAVPIESTSVNPVNMILSGQTLNGLRPTESNDTSVLMSYAPKDAGKIIGNKARNYDLVGLNNKNRELVRQEMIKEYKDNLGKVPKNIEIHIGK